MSPRLLFCTTGSCRALAVGGLLPMEARFILVASRLIKNDENIVNAGVIVEGIFEESWVGRRNRENSSLRIYVSTSESMRT